MAYKNNIPQPTDRISQSQADLLNNFASIKALVDVNHVTFDDVVNQGKHKKVDITNLAADPATTAGELTLYNKGDNLFLRKQNNGDIVNLLGSTAGHTANGYEVLPSGLIINWGYIYLPTRQNDVTAVFTKPFPVAAFRIIHSVSVSINFDPKDSLFPTITLTKNNCKFARDATKNQAGVTISYIAIGH